MSEAQTKLTDYYASRRLGGSHKRLKLGESVERSLPSNLQAEPPVSKKAVRVRRKPNDAKKLGLFVGPSSGLPKNFFKDSTTILNEIRLPKRKLEPDAKEPNQNDKQLIRNSDLTSCADEGRPPACVRLAQLAEPAAAVFPRLPSFEDSPSKKPLEPAHSRLAYLAKKQPAEISPAKTKSDTNDESSLAANGGEERGGGGAESEWSLELPSSHRLLLEMFRSSDTVVSLLFGRDERITFPKLKRAVQQMVKRDFDMKHLGQIKTVYPDAYYFNLVQNVSPFGQRSRIDAYELLISPNLETDLSGCASEETASPRKSGGTPTCPGAPQKAAPPSPRDKTPAKRPPTPRKLNGARIMQRAHLFRRYLARHVIKLHEEFLAGLSPPVTLSAEESAGLRRWHPQFRLDQVEEVPPTPLPQPPSQHAPRTAKQLLDTAPPSFPERIKQALATNGAQLGPQVTLGNSPTKKKVPKILQGVSSSVLQKVRAKQIERDKVNLLRNPDVEQRLKRLARIPDFIRIIRSYCLAEGKNALPLASVVAKLKESYGVGLSTDDIEQHLELMKELLPDFISSSAIQGKGVYLKVETDRPTHRLASRIEAEHKRINTVY